MASSGPIELEDREALRVAEEPLQLADVYRTEADFVWRSLARLGVRPPDRKDMTQEVFIIANRKWSSFREGSSVRAWLFGIARRVASAHRRRAHHQRELIVADVPETAGDGGPEETIAQRQAEERLTAILDRMSLDQRAVFVMFELDGLSCQEIAEIMACPIGTVYSRLAAARKRFEAQLERLRIRDAGEMK